VNVLRFEDVTHPAAAEASQNLVLAIEHLAGPEPGNAERITPGHGFLLILGDQNTVKGRRAGIDRRNCFSVDPR
jgi:hypothetical protein